MTTTHVWHNGQVAALRRMVGCNMSLSQIGSALGLSRGAVSGKLSRLGLTSPDRGTRLPKVMRQPKPLPRAAKPPATPAITPALRGDGAPVTLLSVADGECRFPTGGGHGGGLVLCGHKAKPGASYCECHQAIAFHKVPKVKS